MAVKILQFFAIMLSAICLAPATAHLAELPAKIGLEREAYFATQQLYRGWALFGLAIVPTILVGAILAFLMRDQAGPALWALCGTLGVAATLVVFFVVIEPANRATENWTSMPESWQAVRQQWEYGHAANAVVTFLALGAFVIGGLGWRDG